MSSRRHRERKVYIGNLTQNTSKQEVENILSKYGRLKNVWIARKPPGFAFVDFEDSRDAAYAVRELDGSRICGVRVRVELSHDKTTKNSRERLNRERRSHKSTRRRSRRSHRYRSRSRSRSSSRTSRSYSRSRSRSHNRSKKLYSRSRSKSH